MLFKKTVGKVFEFFGITLPDLNLDIQLDLALAIQDDVFGIMLKGQFFGLTPDPLICVYRYSDGNLNCNFLKVLWSLIKAGVEFVVKKITEFFSKLGDEIKFALNQAGQWISKNILEPVDNFFKGQCTCSDGNEQSGLLCYPKCKAGFYGVMTQCYPNCPDGFRNDGLYCGKPGAYGRGAGYAIWSEGSCNRDNKQGCEKWGLIWYPKCKANFHNVACCVCSPDCPSGMSDIGVSCHKDATYGRGAGYVLNCASKSKIKRSLLESKKFKQDMKEIETLGKKQAKETEDFEAGYKTRVTDFSKGEKAESDKLIADQDKALKDEQKKNQDKLAAEKDAKKKEELQKELSGNEVIFTQRQRLALEKLMSDQKAKRKTFFDGEGKKKARHGSKTAKRAR